MKKNGMEEGEGTEECAVDGGKMWECKKGLGKKESEAGIGVEKGDRNI